MCLHIAHALENGAQNVMVGTVDTVVIVILGDMFFMLIKKHQSAHIWVAFGKGKNFR